MIKKHLSGNKTYLAIFILSIVCFISSIMVYELHQGSEFATGVCSVVGNLSDCETVGNSTHAKLFGFDNSFLGIGGFLLMILFSGYLLFKKSELFEKLLLAGSIFASILAVYFLILQTFVIQAFCTYCVIVDVCSIAMCYILVKKKFF